MPPKEDMKVGQIESIHPLEGHPGGGGSKAPRSENGMVGKGGMKQE